MICGDFTAVKSVDVFVVSKTFFKSCKINKYDIYYITAICSDRYYVCYHDSMDGIMVFHTYNKVITFHISYQEDGLNRLKIG